MQLNIFCDGGARGNPGPAACAFIVFDGAENIREKCGKYLGPGTNNQAEYAAVYEALAWLVANYSALDLTNGSNINFYLDSLLVVKQLTGEFQVKEPGLRVLFARVKKLETELGGQTSSLISYHHVPREKNSLADALVNTTLDKEVRSKK